MTAIIKGRDAIADAVRALPTCTSVRPEAASKDPVVAALEDEVSALRALLETVQAEHAQAILQARQEGRREAAAQYSKDDAEALAVLERAADTAASDMRDRLASLDSAAFAISEAALSRVLAQPDQYQTLVSGVIAAQLESLSRAVVLGIRVSAADFADESKLAELTARYETIAIVADAALPRGACRIDLSLGHIAISVPDYWDALRARLRTLAETSAS